MKESIFENIKQNLNLYKHTSMIYTDYDEISEYEVISNNEKCILICGYKENAKDYEYHWAANSAEDVINLITKENCFLTFIPHEWIKDFEKAGFSIRNAWHDYFKSSLSDMSDEYLNAYTLQEEEYKEAAEVTMSCRNKSRGFTGETENFMRDWMMGKDQFTNDSTVFVEKNELGNIVGLVCTGTYGHDSEKGAVAWIREICVRPECQNKGIARRLLKQALSYGKSKGAIRAYLAADEMNENAIHLYTSIGFVASDEKSEIDMIRKN